MKGLSHYEVNLQQETIQLDINVTPEIVTVTITEYDKNLGICTISSDPHIRDFKCPDWRLSEPVVQSFTALNESEREYVLQDNAEKNMDIAKALRALAYKLETGEPIEVI